MEHAVWHTALTLDTVYLRLISVVSSIDELCLRSKLPCLIIFIPALLCSFSFQNPFNVHYRKDVNLRCLRIFTYKHVSVLD